MIDLNIVQFNERGNISTITWKTCWEFNSSTENFDLKKTFNVIFLAIFHYKIEFLARKLDTRLQFEYFISLHLNSPIS